MKKGPSPINLFHYSDYRRFLRDWYHEVKRSRAALSLRSFAERAGFHSSNFLMLVMQGKRNLSEKSIGKCAKGLKLNKQEREFFKSLVLFNQSESHKEKDRYYQLLLRSRKFNQLKPIEKHQYEYCSSWYHAVIRELVVSKEFDGTPEWLTERIFPSITPAQAEKSIELLEKLGFIQKTKKGKWRQSSSILSTGPEVKSLALFNYHKNMLDLSKETLERIDASERDVSAMTLGITEGSLTRVKKEVQEFRQKILKIVSVEEHPDTVIQLNMQMFPLTKLRGLKKS